MEMNSIQINSWHWKPVWAYFFSTENPQSSLYRVNMYRTLWLANHTVTAQPASNLLEPAAQWGPQTGIMWAVFNSLPMTFLFLSTEIFTAPSGNWKENPSACSNQWQRSRWFVWVHSSKGTNIFYLHWWFCFNKRLIQHFKSKFDFIRLFSHMLIIF